MLTMVANIPESLNAKDVMSAHHAADQCLRLHPQRSGAASPCLPWRAPPTYPSLSSQPDALRDMTPTLFRRVHQQSELVDAVGQVHQRLVERGLAACAGGICDCPM